MLEGANEVIVCLSQTLPCRKEETVGGALRIVVQKLCIPDFTFVCK